MTRFRQYEMTAAEWTAQNPVLLKGEVGWETGSPPKAKKGDGVTAWTALPYAIQPGAPIASPVFTGDPRAPTPVVSDNDTSIATTAFVKTAIAALIAGSPALLDTLDELAAALGDDPNFAATMATALGLKAPIASPTFTGDPKAPTPTAGDNDTSIATTAFVKAALDVFNGGSAVGIHSNRERQTSQALTNVTEAVVDYNVVVSETGIVWDTTNKRWTAPKAGRYVVMATVHFDPNATGFRRLRLVHRSGGSSFIRSLGQLAGMTGAGISVHVAQTIRMAVNDTVEFAAYQSSGGSLSVYGDSSSGATNASIAYIGA